MDVLLPTSRLRIYVFPLVPGALRLWVWTPMAFMRGDAFFFTTVPDVCGCMISLGVSQFGS